MIGNYFEQTNIHYPGIYYYVTGPHLGKGARGRWRFASLVLIKRKRKRKRKPPLVVYQPYKSSTCKNIQIAPPA